MMAAALKVDHVVKSADGVLYRVSYVDVHRAEASLRELGAGFDDRTYVTLPLAELRRVPDPDNAKGPIVGLPEERPVCQYCGARFRPVCDNVRDDPSDRNRITRREFRRWSSYRGLFHSLGCALNFATASHRAGYRIKSKSTT